MSSDKSPKLIRLGLAGAALGVGGAGGFDGAAGGVFAGIVHVSGRVRLLFKLADDLSIAGIAEVLEQFGINRVGQKMHRAIGEYRIKPGWV